MKRGRKPLVIPRVEKKVYLDSDVEIQLNELLKDPMKGKVAYGALSDLINMLLREHIKSLRHDSPNTAS